VEHADRQAAGWTQLQRVFSEADDRLVGEVFDGSILSTQNAIEVIRLASVSPGGLPTLRVLATPIARTIIDELLAKRLSRHELSQLGPAPRVSDALNLELLGSIQRDGQFVLLLEPTVHREILDLVDQILADTHQREYRQARSRLNARAATRGPITADPSAPCA
jgi:hypothetical protein